MLAVDARCSPSSDIPDTSRFLETSPYSPEMSPFLETSPDRPDDILIFFSKKKS